ncbi:MAG: tetratricopeptide repeat protein [Phycisphaeraceae bacterium]|nr:tetratricopeptide repeat protein [Phycisphaeraceae bacterium]
MPPIRRTALILMLACIASLTAPARAQQGDDDRRAFLAGNGFLSRGMDALAAQEYEKFLVEHPGHTDAPTARYGLGVACNRLGRYQDALRALDGLDHLPGFRFADEAMIVAGSAEFALGNYEQCARRLRPLLTSDEPDKAAAAAPLLIEAMHRTGEHEETVQIARTAEQRLGADALTDRGALFAALSAERIKEGKLAIGWSTWTMKHTEDVSLRTIAALCIARESIRAGDADGAIGVCERALRDGDPGLRPEALRLLADAQVLAGRAEEADRVYATLEHESPELGEDHDVLIQRGMIAFDEERYEQALRFLMRGDDGSEEVARWAARCEIRLGRASDAARRLAAIADPGPSAIYELGVAFQQSGRLDEAYSTFERYLRVGGTISDPIRAHAMSALASIDHERQRHAPCAARCREILDNPSIGDASLRTGARMLLAESLYLQGDLEGARDAYKGCLAESSSDDARPSIAYRLGMIHAQLGNSGAAETILRSITRGASRAEEFVPALRTLGDLAMGREDWAAAVSSYEAYLQRAPSVDGSTLMKLGIALARTGDERGAVESLDRAINGGLAKEQAARAHFERGDLRRSLGDEAGSESDWREALRLDVSGEIRTAAGMRLSSAAIAGGDTEAARRLLRSVIESSQDAAASAEATLDLGRLELQAGDNDTAARTLAGIEIGDLPEARWSEALACLSIACARSGDDAGASRADAALTSLGTEIVPGVLVPLLYERAWRFRRHGDTDSAIASYRELLDQRPDEQTFMNTVVELADLLVQSGDSAGAIATLRDLPLGSASDEAAIRLGALLYQQGAYSEVVDALQGALVRADPGDRSLDSSRLICGESLHRLGLWSLAAARFSVAARSEDPSIAAPALLRLGTCAAELQRWDDSASAYSDYLDRFPSGDRRSAAQFGIGWARESAGDPESAISAYREAASGRSETAARAQFQIGECLFALGRHEEAAGELLKVDILYAAPAWSAAALYEAGRCFDAMGDTERAREQWRRVLELEDSGDWAPMARARLGAATEKPTTTTDAAPRSTNTSID